MSIKAMQQSIHKWHGTQNRISVLIIGHYIGNMRRIDNDELGEACWDPRAHEASDQRGYKQMNG